MMVLIRYMYLGIMLMASASVYGEGWDAAFYERRAVKFIKAAADWTIEEGISTYHEGGRKGVQKKLDDKWLYVVALAGAGLPYVDSEGYLAKFWLHTNGVEYEIVALHREALPDSVYEFWIVKVTRVDRRSSDTNRSIFYVTRADDVRGRREILHRRNQFIECYKIGAERYMEFPVDDLEVVSKMQAWRYPESYPDSDLKNLRVGKHWKTGRITVERGDAEQWAYEEEMDGNLMWLAEVTHAFKRAIRAGGTYSEAEWEEVYEGLVRQINGSGRPIKEKDWKRYKRRFNKLERLDKTAAKTRFDAQERLNIEWEEEN